MQENIAIAGYTLTAVPTPLTVTVTKLTATNTSAMKCSAASTSILINSLAVNCVCAGAWSTGDPFTGNGTGSIVASTPRVTCEGQSILTQDDSVTISCPGSFATSGGPVNATATVKVTITAAGQLTVNANKA